MARHADHSRRSVLTLPAAHRLVVAAGLAALLWLAVLWSVALP